MDETARAAWYFGVPVGAGELDCELDKGAPMGGNALEHASLTILTVAARPASW